MLKGTGVSDGCGIGTAVVIEEKELDYSSVVYTTAEEEKARLNAAVNTFCERTERIVLSGNRRSWTQRVFQEKIRPAAMRMTIKIG